MEATAVDLFATKGLEYLLIIGYLLLLVSCWRFVRPARQRPCPDTEDGSGSGDGARPTDRGRPELMDGCYYHQGHAWARGVGGSVMRVGMDAFARQLLGPAAAFVLPEPGTRLIQGQPGWEVEMEGRRIPVLSPVDGEVVARNEALLRSPSAGNDGAGGAPWILEVRVPDPAAVARNLLSGDLARAWAEDAMARVRSLAGGRDPAVAETEGPGNGWARFLEAEHWDRLARTFLLTDETHERDGAQAVQEG